MVVLKMMDSWCLVGKKVFRKFDDAEMYRLWAQKRASKMLDTEEVNYSTDTLLRGNKHVGCRKATFLLHLEHED